MAVPIPIRSYCLLLFAKKFSYSMKHNNLYSGLVTPSSGWWSPIGSLQFVLNPPKVMEACGMFKIHCKNCTNFLPINTDWFFHFSSCILVELSIGKKVFEGYWNIQTFCNIQISSNPFLLQKCCDKMGKSKFNGWKISKLF